MNPIQLAIIAFVVVVILLTLGYYWYDDAKFKRKVENNFNQAGSDVLIDENKATVFDGIDSRSHGSVAEHSKFMQKDVELDSGQNRLDDRQSSQHIRIKRDPLLGDVGDKHNSEKLTSVNNKLIYANNKLDEPSNEPVKAEVSKAALKNEGVAETNIQLGHRLSGLGEGVPDVPEDSVEAFFVKLDQFDFGFIQDINREFDLVIDIVFEEPKKLKILPEITQFTHKYFIFYVMDKDNVWQIFEKGKKYQVKALKLVVQLVDNEGVISQAQIENIYNELHKFVVKNDAHIRCSDYEKNILNIQEQIKLLNNIELTLELYLLSKDKIQYSALNKFFVNNGLNQLSGIFSFMEDKNALFTIANENQGLLSNKDEYNLLSVTAKLHLHKDPLYVLDKIFELSEKFMQQFESRLLTTNKQVISQKEYDQLYDYVKRYADSARKKRIQLGGDLIRRLF